MNAGFAPAFWQALLAAEVSAFRAEQIVREIVGSGVDPIGFLTTRARLTPAELERIRGVDPRALESALAAGVEILERDRMSAPLLDSKNPPFALFANGNVDVLDRPAVAIVGTRSASTYGKAVAMKFSEALARSGIVVVSGGAHGVDAAAHKGCLAEGGSTVAVLAHGVDQAYPAMHRSLFERIRESGCLLSPFAIGIKPSRYRFLVRNHVIAALSAGVLVVEAPEQSGALSTAHAAAEMGRQVWVVPANIDQPGFKGSHALIRDGASLVDHPHQILADLGIEPAPAPARSESARSVPQTAILHALEATPLAVEKIVLKTQLSPEEVLAELTMLELDGLVLREDGGFARRP
ncbi:MAG TPA: DNA-processing protein DprA [Fimbriimonadaceae bacterium]|nr:DNA-processing protein DprA [Fimbriimonadaceae bacterium]